MGNFSDKQNVQQVDPRTQQGREAETMQSGFLNAILSNPTAWMQMFNQQSASPLTGGANNAILAALGQGGGTNYGASAFNQAQPTLAALMNGGAASGLNFGNQFSELQNPYGVLGGMNPALATIAASAPQYDEQRQRALADLQAAAPNRFSGGFVQEGTDLSRKSLQDYNAFAAQALQQGISQQQASQQMGLNFLLGARQLQQGAAQDTAGNLLSQAGLINTAQTGGLGALGALSQGAMSGQNNLLNFLLGAGNLGVQQQQANINPILQLIQGAMGWQGTPLDSAVLTQQGWGSSLINMAGNVAGNYIGNKLANNNNAPPPPNVKFQNPNQKP